MEKIDIQTITISVATVLAVALVSSCTAINVHKRADSAVQMQQNGADPLDIPCAIGDATERYCQLRAASKAAAAR